jgi:hypothetical protein
MKALGVVNWAKGSVDRIRTGGEGLIVKQVIGRVERWRRGRREVKI